MLCVVVFFPYTKTIYIFGITTTCFILLLYTLLNERVSIFRMPLVVVFIISLAKAASAILDYDYPVDAIIVFAPLLLYWILSQRSLLKQWFCKVPADNWLVYFAIYSFLAVVALFTWTIFSDNQPQLINIYGESIWKLIWIGAVFSIVNSLYEEFLFRGCIFSALLRSNGVIVAMLVQAITFATIHFVAGVPNGIAGFLLAFAYGLLMGHLFIKGKSLWPCIFSHIVCDISVFIIILRSQQYA